MKNPSLILFLSAFLLLRTHAYAQTDNTFFVGTESLDEIEEQLIEVRFNGWRKPFSISIYYGQDCSDGFGMLGLRPSKTAREECVGLKDEEGNMVTFNTYIIGLNFMDKQGFELIEIIQVPESSWIHASSFIFKRKPQ